MEAKKLSISLKTIFIVLGVIALTIIGIAVAKMFEGQNVAGKTYVSVPTEKNQKIESMIFTESGNILGETYSQETEKWTSVPFSGKYEFQDDKLYLSSTSGFGNMSAVFKWIGKDKFEVIDNNSDTTVYVLKGSDEDVSLLGKKHLIGKTFVMTDPARPGELYCYYFKSEDHCSVLSYDKEAGWENPEEQNYYIENNKITFFSDEFSTSPENIIWLNKDKFMVKYESSTSNFILKGSKDDPSLKN